jgi:hypothetical protein
MWALMVIGLPLLARGLYWIAESIELRRGPSPAARRFRQAGWVASGLQGRMAPGRRRWWTV